VSARDDNDGGAVTGGLNAAPQEERSRPAPQDEARRPFGVVVASVVDGFRTLVRQRAELARLEVTEAATTRATGAGMMGAAAVIALFAVGFVAAAIAAALALVLPVWAAILIVAALLLACAGVLVLVGRRTLRTAPPPTDRTRETLKEDARWARQQIAR
jgi:fatty acid desaturase